jgi:hypothetical protein
LLHCSPTAMIRRNCGRNCGTTRDLNNRFEDGLNATLACPSMRQRRTGSSDFREQCRGVPSAIPRLFCSCSRFCIKVYCNPHVQRFDERADATHQRHDRLCRQ